MTNLRMALDNPVSVPAPAGNYSHVARLELGDAVLIMISGQLALGERGQLIGEGSMAQQSERVFEILSALLAAHGASFADVVNIRTYLTEMSHINDYGAVRREHLGDDPPTSTTVEVSRLVLPAALVEVDLMAAIPAPSE